MLSTTLRRVLVASGLTIATSFITALSASAATKTANSTAGFTGTIDPSCAVKVDFPNAASSKLGYTKSAYAGSGAGSVLKLSANQNATFDCNSDTVNVSADVTLTQPTAPANATAIVGVHTTTISNANTGATDTANANGAGNALVTGSNWITDPNGNIVINVASEWNPTIGEELLDGTYTAVVKVTVTPN